MFRAVCVSLCLLWLFALPLHAATDWEEAAELRKAGQLDQAERKLRQYASPAGFDQLKSAERIDFLRGLLELAHVRALKEDVSGSLALLNWAESCPDAYQRAISCICYAGILLDLGEFDRAKGYLKNADETIAGHATEETAGAAIGQSGESADTGAAWRELRDESAALKADVESEELKEKFGATYGNYVKLRRLRNVAKRARLPRYRKEAMKIADEIIETDPASQFAAAAGYLKGELLADRLKEDSPKKEIKEAKEYLEKFVKQQPEGLYRGEALMLLGKISLEIEWDAKDAEKYYTQALDWFRKAREKRDALSLYAPVSEDLKKQTEATKKPTSLDQWKRVVYHDEDPLKLYNTASAPAWYIDDKEKNCLRAAGITKFINNDFDMADKLWEKAGQLDEGIKTLEAIRAPNLLKRLRVSCAQKFLITDAEEQTGISKSERVRIVLAEMHFMEERIAEAKNSWVNLQQTLKVTPAAKAIALMGEADCLRMLDQVDRKRAEICYRAVLNDREMAKTPAAARAMYNLAWLTVQSGIKNRESANRLFEECVEKNPKSKYAEASLFYLALTNAGYDRLLSEKYAGEYFRKYPNGIYGDRLKLRLKQMHSRSVNQEKRRVQ